MHEAVSHWKVPSKPVDDSDLHLCKITLTIEWSEWELGRQVRGGLCNPVKKQSLTLRLYPEE